MRKSAREYVCDRANSFAQKAFNMLKAEAKERIGLFAIGFRMEN